MISRIATRAVHSSRMFSRTHKRPVDLESVESKQIEARAKLLEMQKQQKVLTDLKSYRTQVYRNDLQNVDYSNNALMTEGLISVAASLHILKIGMAVSAVTMPQLYFMALPLYAAVS